LKICGSPGAVLAVKFSPDGKRLATASTDNTIRVWDIIMKDGVPLALNNGRALASKATVIPISFSGGRDPKRIGFEGSSEYTQFCFMDGRRRPTIGDWSYVDDDGWVRNKSESGGYDPLQFWLPPANRKGFWWPRNSAVMTENVTRVDLSRFVHGEEWHLCRTSGDTEAKNPSEVQA